MEKKMKNVRMMICLMAALVLVVYASAALADTIYVSMDTRTIEQFTSDGIGSVFAYDPTGDGLFLSCPEHIAFDRTGNLYVANPTCNTVGKLSPGGIGSVFASTNWPISLACDKANNLYVASYFNGEIEKFSPSGVDLGVFASTGGRIRDLAIDSADNLYCIYSYKQSTLGTTISKITPGGTISVFANTLTYPNESLAIDSADNLYVSTFGGSSFLIEKFSSTGTDLGAFTTTGIGMNPTAMAFDSAGNLYVVNYSPSLVEKFSPSGVDLGVFGSGLTSPRGIAIQVCQYALMRDLNGDCRCDFNNFALFGAQWMNTNCSASGWCADADFDKNGSVDTLDLATFAGYWLEGN
jgi:sugar lactone lactonase YvrE